MKNSVQTFLVIALIFLTSIYMITTMVSYENEIGVNIKSSPVAGIIYKFTEEI